MTTRIKIKSGLKWWLAFFTTLLIGVVLTSLVINLFIDMFLTGAGNAWGSLAKPPSPAIHILQADSYHIWIETQDLQKFTISLNCYETENCNKWVKAENIPETVEGSGFSSSRGTNCESLDQWSLPSSPSGRVVECVRVSYAGPEFGSVNYFALLADGTLRHWVHSDSSITREVYKIFSFFLVILVGVSISVFYLMLYIVRRARKNRETKSQLAGL